MTELGVIDFQAVDDFELHIIDHQAVQRSQLLASGALPSRRSGLHVHLQKHHQIEAIHVQAILSLHWNFDRLEGEAVNESHDDSLLLFQIISFVFRSNLVQAIHIGLLLSIDQLLQIGLDFKQLGPYKPGSLLLGDSDDE